MMKSILLLGLLAFSLHAKAQELHGRPLKEARPRPESHPALMGRPDGHEPGFPNESHNENHLIGRPDGHEPRNIEDKPLIGRPDGHEPGNIEDEPSIGRPDGHEPGDEPRTDEDKPLIGRPDGHEHGTDEEKPLIGRPDGHEPVIPRDDSNKPLIDHPDWHQIGPNNSNDTRTVLPGQPDGHEPGLEVQPSADSEYEADSSEEQDGEEIVMEVLPEEHEQEEETGNEELVRCKRPMCLMYCENGFQTDSTGCPVCHCKEVESVQPIDQQSTDSFCISKCEMFCETGLNISSEDDCPPCECMGKTSVSPLGSGDDHRPCPPICRMFCERGFKTDERGCPVCSCLENPCATVDCASGSLCQVQPCENTKSCTKLAAICVPPSKSLMCPEPMCANACPHGYKTNEEGCMTCDCDGNDDNVVPKERVCGPFNCEEGLICRNSTDGSRPKCSVKSICETQRGQPVALGGASLMCEPDGSFKPIQCNPVQADCWCVDGLGHEILDSRTTVFIDEQKPKCLRNITVSMHVHLTFVAKHDFNDLGQLESLNSTIVDHASAWLLIEPEYIRVARAETVSSDVNATDDSSDEEKDDDYNNIDDDDDAEEADDDGSRDLDSSRMIVVELIVSHDGQSDLPSAADYMQRRMHMGLCDIPVGRGSLLPNPYTLRTEHEFAQPPMTAHPFGEESFDGPERKPWHCWRGARIGILVGLAALIVLVTVTVVKSIKRRRRHLAEQQFKHTILAENNWMEEDLLGDEKPGDRDMYVSDEKKLPIA